MVADKRARNRPLIRPAAAMAMKNIPQTGINGAASHPHNHGHTQIQLEQLTALHASGVLTDEEFSMVKQRLLGL